MQSVIYYLSSSTKDPEKDYDLKRLEKINHYRDRYEANLKSVKHAENKRTETIKAYRSLEGIFRENKDDIFLHDALDLIVESRRAITMTYALGYYSEMDANRKAIFEMN